MRLFTAIDLPEDFITVLSSALAQFPRLRWMDYKQLHLTLRFLGEVHDKNIGDLINALKNVPVSEFILEPEGSGFFPDRRRPNVFWTGLKSNNSLDRLKLDMEQVLEDFGFPRENRSFKPHITLLRIKHRMAPRLMDKLSETFDALALPLVKVNSFKLFSSKLLPSGAVHSVIETFGD